MPAYRGILKRIGSKEGDMIVNSSGNSAVGNVRVSGKVSVIEIGETTLRNVGCTNDVYDLLDPGRDAVLYVHQHFFIWPVVIGVKYPDSGKTYMMGFGTLIASALAYLIIYPMLVLAAGFMIGLMGGSSAGFMSTLGILVIVGGLGLCVWNAGILVKNYLGWRAS